MSNIKIDAQSNGDISDFVSEVTNIVSDSIIHEWEDFGIGSYEFWGAKGYDSRWEPILPEIISLSFYKDVPIIPIKLKGTYYGGGCPDFKHHCNKNCRDVEIDFVYNLINAKNTNTDIIAEYELG